MQSHIRNYFYPFALSDFAKQNCNEGFKILKKLFACIALLSQCVALAIPNTFHYVDYDTSMQTKSYPDALRITKQIIGIDGVELNNFFKELYEANNLTKVALTQQPKIPKIIHQIWLGSPVPDAFKVYMQSWIDHHPDWQYHLWTDEEVKKITLYNQHFYDRTESFGVKSDLLKWEIVYRYGGVYIDVDYECLQPLDIFHHSYDFYTGLQPLDAYFVQLGAALFGATPGHPILKYCIETIKDDWFRKGAPSKSGPVHFTKSFFATAGKDGRIDIALPAHYLYPLGCKQTELKHAQWIAAGSYAVHHWAKSWMPPSYRPQKFKDFANQNSDSKWND